MSTSIDNLATKSRDNSLKAAILSFDLFFQKLTLRNDPRQLKPTNILGYIFPIHLVNIPNLKQNNARCIDLSLLISKQISFYLKSLVKNSNTFPSESLQIALKLADLLKFTNNNFKFRIAFRNCDRNRLIVNRTYMFW